MLGERACCRGDSEVMPYSHIINPALFFRLDRRSVLTVLYKQIGFDRASAITMLRHL